MAKAGFIHDKLDIKFLVLYLMARVASPVDFSTLADLTFCDDGVEYFDFAAALAELVDTGHLELKDDKYSITEKGRRNGKICESSLAYSVRRKCDRNLAKVNGVLRRDAQVRAEILPRDDGAHTLRLILDDDKGNIMTLDLLTVSEEQAGRLAENSAPTRNGCTTASSKCFWKQKRKDNAPNNRMTKLRPVDIVK